MLQKEKQTNQIQKLGVYKFSKLESKFLIGKGNTGATEELYGAYHF